MDRVQIRGGARLNGVIPISGAKNAALPLMIASLLTDQTLTLENLPRLADVSQLARILGNHGVDYSIDGKRPGEEAASGQTAHLRARTIVDTTAPYELVAKMRASFWVIAPLLARTGEARVSLPGGCAIGTRPVDLLLMALEKLGATIEIDGGYAVARAPKGLVGAEIEFPKVTVGGTHVAIMAASMARGATLIVNAAREPEVEDLADCLNKMGARIRGAGTSTIEIQGAARLNGANHRVLPDRIEAGTYATAVAMTGGDILLEGVGEDLLQRPLETLARSGATVTSDNRGVRVRRNGAGIDAVVVASSDQLADILETPMTLLPGRHLVDNLIEALTAGTAKTSGVAVSTMMFNSLVMALVIASGKIAISLPSAYAVVFFRFPLRKLCFWAIFVTLMLPVEVRIIADLRCRRRPASDR